MAEKIERLPGLTVKSTIVGILLIAITAGWCSVFGTVPNVSWYPTWTGDQGEAYFFGFMY